MAETVTGTITGAEMAATLRVMAEEAMTLRDQLNLLDAALGDGDTGITVAKAAGGLLDYLNANAPSDDLGKYLATAGMAVNRVASSTLGTLVATAFMRAGKAAQGQSALDQPLLARMVQAANAGIQERGKAKLGDKTLVDALHPAAEAFVAATERGDGLDDALTAMVAAARQGRDAAIALRSRMGRAAWVGERTENQPDPGTVLVVYLLETVAGIDRTAPGSTLE